MTDHDSPAAAKLAGPRLDARRLAWQAAALTGGARHPLSTLQRADPIGAWIDEAEDDEQDLAARADALRVWVDAALTLLGAGVPPADDPVRVVASLGDIHAWLTRPPGTPRVRPGTAPGGLSGRQVFLLRCLLLAATEGGNGRDEMIPSDLADAALRYTRPLDPPVDAAEIAAVIAAVFSADHRDNGTGTSGVHPGTPPGETP